MMKQSTMLIDVENLSVCYGREPVIKDLSLRVGEREWVLVTGPSGGGKSTLARTLCGLIPHSISSTMKGHVRIAGKSSEKYKLPELSQHVGIVLQNPDSQLFHLKVGEEIAFGVRNLGLKESEVDQRVREALEAVGIPHLRARRPDKLSGGQKQLVAIASMLAMQPQVMVLDEPTASLDVSGTNRVMQTLSKLNSKLGITIIMVEHRLHVDLRDVDRVYVMNEGQIAVEGLPGEIFIDEDCRKDFGLRRPGEQPMSSWRNLIKRNVTPDNEVEPMLSL